MTFNTKDLRDGHLPLLERIDIALRRVTNGEGQMRVPVEATDPDIVLHNCRDRIVELEAELDAKDKRIAELEANLAETRAQFVLLDNEQASANSKADRVIAELETQLAEARDIIANGREQRRLDVMTIAAQADVIDERNAQLAEARAEVERLRTQPTPLTALLLNEKEANEYKNAVATIELLKATRTVPL